MALTDPPNKFLRLPNELFAAILSRLSNRDIKQLRLTCGLVRERAQLRLTRVFVSASPRNIKVLYCIANHPDFCKQVTEIIWDDATLAKFWQEGEYEDEESRDWDEENGCPMWFTRACHYELQALKTRKHRDVDRPDHIARQKQIDASLPLSTSWVFYQKLLDEQDQIISSGSDVGAFRYALSHFPSLQRVTITPAAHGFLFTPLYETPMIRSFPFGFRYPIPHGWPYAGDAENEPEAPLWVDDSDEETQETVRNQWRGFRLVTDVLAQKEVQHHVSELILAVHGLNTGLNCHIFDQPCHDYDNFAALLRRPSFHRLDLSLLVGELEHYDWISYRSGLLRKALAGAPNLEHIQLHTNMAPDIEFLNGLASGTQAADLSLRTIFPIENWPILRHFGLSGFLLCQEDLISLLSELPGTLRSVELSFLKFWKHKGNYHKLLYDLRDKLNWRNRVPGERPKVIIGLHHSTPRPGRAIWVSKEAEAFIYGAGENPFDLEDGTTVFPGTAGVERDEFEPAHERPWARPNELRRLGIRQ